MGGVSRRRLSLWTGLDEMMSKVCSNAEVKALPQICSGHISQAELPSLPFSTNTSHNSQVWKQWTLSYMSPLLTTGIGPEVDN